MTWEEQQQIAQAVAVEINRIQPEREAYYEEIAGGNSTVALAVDVNRDIFWFGFANAYWDGNNEECDQVIETSMPTSSTHPYLIAAAILSGVRFYEEQQQLLRHRKGVR